MARITSGTFKYTRRVKPGDPNEYNAPFREATAEISWSVGEDETVEDAAAIIVNASEATVVKVNEMLGAKATPKTEVSAENPQVPTGRDILTAEDNSQSASLKAAADMMALEKPKGKPGRKLPEQSVMSQTEQPAQKNDLLEDDLLSPSVVEVTAADLLEAITRKNSERMQRPEGTMLADGRDGRGVQLIRDLIGKYVQLPQTARDIPMPLRHKFLEELKSL
jgi:hypothetical protein